MQAAALCPPLQGRSDKALLFQTPAWAGGGGGGVPVLSQHDVVMVLALSELQLQYAPHPTVTPTPLPPPLTGQEWGETGFLSLPPPVLMSAAVIWFLPLPQTSCIALGTSLSLTLSSPRS